VKEEALRQDTWNSQRTQQHQPRSLPKNFKITKNREQKGKTTSQDTIASHRPLFDIQLTIHTLGTLAAPIQPSVKPSTASITDSRFHSRLLTLYVTSRHVRYRLRLSARASLRPTSFHVFRFHVLSLLLLQWLVPAAVLLGAATPSPARDARPGTSS
jgi:hypothetical protein